MAPTVGEKNAMQQNGMLVSREPTLTRVEVHPMSSYNIGLGR